MIRLILNSYLNSGKMQLGHAGVVQWQNTSFPNWIRGFDSLHPLSSFAKATDDSLVYYVYILQSSKSNILYCGFTRDLRNRIEEHNSGKTKFTKGHIPWKLVWYSAFKDKQKAKDFELYLKSGSGKAFAYKRLVALGKDESVKKQVIRSFSVGHPSPAPIFGLINLI